MTKRKKRLKPDTVLKRYWDNNEQFADLFNAVLFRGNAVIKPEDVENMDTESSSIVEHREFAESITASRDNIKICKKFSVIGTEFILLGIESQEHIHYAMPMRVMGYDYSAYKKQYDKNAVKYKKAKGMTEEEFLSKMKKTDKFFPVITIVIYYGDKVWDGAKSLHGMLDIPKGLEKYVNDYHVLLVEVGNNDLVLHNINNKDLFALFRILLDEKITTNEAKKKAIEYSEEHKTDKEVIVTVAGATNSRIDCNVLEKGEKTMCRVFDEIAKENEAIGEAKGIIETGFEFGASESDILTRLQNKLNVSLQMAQEYLEMFGKQAI